MDSGKKAQVHAAKRILRQKPSVCKSKKHGERDSVLFYEGASGGEAEEGFPVFRCHVVDTRADAIEDSGADESRKGRHGRIGRGGRMTVELPNGGSQEGCLEFSGGIGPGVLFSRLDEERTRGDEGEEVMLVDRQIRLPMIELFVGRAEPMWKLSIDGGNGFALSVRKNGAGERGARAAGAVGDDGGETRIACSGVEGGFSETGMSPHCDGSDEIGQLLEQVHAAAQRPCPSGDAPPRVLGLCRVSRIALKSASNTVLPSVRMIGFGFVVTHGSETVPGFKDPLKIVARGGGAARADGVVPIGDEDSGIVGYGLISLEIQSPKDRDGAFCAGGKVKKNSPRVLGGGGEREIDLEASSETVERIWGIIDDLVGEFGRQVFGRHFPIHEACLCVEDCGAHGLFPFLAVGRFRTVSEEKRG